MKSGKTWSDVWLLAWFGSYVEPKWLEPKWLEPKWLRSLRDLEQCWRWRWWCFFCLEVVFCWRRWGCKRPAVASPRQATQGTSRQGTLVTGTCWLLFSLYFVLVCWCWVPQFCSLRSVLLFWLLLFRFVFLIACPSNGPNAGQACPNGRGKAANGAQQPNSYISYLLLFIIFFYNDIFYIFI